MISIKELIILTTVRYESIISGSRLTLLFMIILATASITDPASLITADSIIACESRCFLLPKYILIPLNLFPRP